ncbi:VOC family protein [Actinomadura madurae]|uniref:VOC family protein n=1 Tax=Actinomadura madurae TaxID=1993 RepID=UPI00399BF108
MKPSLPPLTVVQNAYVVEDILDACQRFHELYRTGPFMFMDVHPMHDVLYRGKPQEVVTQVAFAQAGELMVELICQHSDGPSAYRDVYAKGEQGFHHIAAFSADYYAELAQYAAAGYEVVMEMAVQDDRVAYIDTRATTGHMLELYPESDALRDIYAKVREAAQQWDGEELIIPYDIH